MLIAGFNAQKKHTDYEEHRSRELGSIQTTRHYFPCTYIGQHADIFVLRLHQNTVAGAGMEHKKLGSLAERQGQWATVADLVVCRMILGVAAH